RDDTRNVADNDRREDAEDFARPATAQEGITVVERRDLDAHKQVAGRQLLCGWCGNVGGELD
ncbi:hypothetical protein HK405_007503, partial [Cladochytrium tenue]